MILEVVRVSAEGADPELALETAFDRLDGIVETTVAVRVRLDVPLAAHGRVGGRATVSGGA